MHTEEIETKKIIHLHDLSFEEVMTAKEIGGIVADMGQQLSNDFRGKNPLIIGILNGAFVFAADLVREIPEQYEMSFVKFSSYKDLASTGDVNNLIGLNEDIAGRHILIVEDIIDTGNTLERFLKDLQNHNPASVSIATLLMKPDVFCDRFHVHYVGLSIPNRFVVGYGLDYNGLGRGLPGIYQLIEQ